MKKIILALLVVIIAVVAFLALNGEDEATDEQNTTQEQQEQSSNEKPKTKAPERLNPETLKDASGDIFPSLRPVVGVFSEDFTYVTYAINIREQRGEDGMRVDYQDPEMYVIVEAKTDEIKAIITPGEGESFIAGWAGWGLRVGPNWESDNVFSYKVFEKLETFASVEQASDPNAPLIEERSITIE